ncbi:MAG: PKD domain-containing protein, partial [Saprospiraceae bacterium]|nr:PKD domain-containing protein [Saprospiraceae bacterium]
CNPLAVDFQTIVTQTPFPIVAWDWDFGDGNNSNLSNPSHTYQAPGTYTVTLNVTDEIGCTNFVSKSNYVQVIGPDVDFSADTTQSCGPLTVQFQDLTTPGAPITSWLWDFGDGSSSNMQNPSHNYASLDSFDVTLTIMDMDGCTTSFTRDRYIQTNALCSPYVCNLTCPEDTIISLGPFGCDVLLPDYSIEDSCLSFLNLISGQLPGTPFPIGTTANEVVLTDPFGFTDTCRFTITVIENGVANSLQTSGKRAAAGLACQDRVNISLGQNCTRVVTAQDVLIENEAGCIDRYNCFLTDPQTGKSIPGNTVSVEQAGHELTYVVQEIASGNRCWGVIKVENKLPPQILCVNDTISCLQMKEHEDLVIITNPCIEFPTNEEVLEKQWTDLGCEDREFIGYLARKVRASDVWGNFKECRDTLFIRKETIDSLICGPDALIECTTEVVRNGKTVELLWNAGKDGDTYLDELGYAHPWPTKGDGYFPAPYLKSTQPGQDPGYLLPNHTDAGPDFANSGKCQIVFMYEDHIVPTCGRSYKIRRTWTIYDWCGHRDTTCVQWFKFTDARAPVIDPGHLHNLDNLVSSEDQIHECDEVPQSVIQESISKQAWLACEVLEAEVDPHDCKATVILPDPRAWVLKDCDDQLEVYYEIEYSDPSHPGKTLLESGTIAEGETAHVYLPAGWHNVLYHIRDRCWNETLLLQGISVYDNTPPTPVCDEITQVTLDPEKCWARIYAKDLDDGSHDNCCDKLHFAVANRDSVTYWDNYWHNYFLNCFGESEYYKYQEGYDAFIEDWINSYVFNDYIDVTECGNEQLVLRVYEACGLPVYDPHTFYGGEHQWYWFNHSPLFLMNYMWKLDEYIHYGNPRYRFVCDNGQFGVDIPVDIRIHILFENIDLNPELTEYGYSACNIFTSSSGSRFEYIAPFLAKTHVPIRWNLCEWLPRTNDAVNDWKKRVFDPYRTEAELTKNLNFKSLYYTPVKYNDCMIEVLKDDKTPPVVVAPEDVTVYCDGVPYWWELTKPYAGGTKTATVKGHGAQYTHDVCEGEDALQTYCSSPDVFPEGKNTSGDYAEGPVCCVEIPWDGGDYGYYGGPVCGEYGNYGDGLNCDGY